MNVIDTAVDLLGLGGDMESTDNAYVVDVSNPVCPKCGAKLVLNDGTTAAETDGLAGMGITESWVSGDDVMPLVRETADSICNSYFEMDDADPNELVYISDPHIKSAIHRKAIELSSLLQNNYEIMVSVPLLELQIKEQIKLIVGNYI